MKNQGSAPVSFGINVVHNLLGGQDPGGPRVSSINIGIKYR